jgi:tetratricopeptide (TPR) repeat protein
MAKTSTTLVVVSAAVVAALVLNPDAPVFADDATHTISAALRKPLNGAHDDLRARNYAEAIATLTAAETVKGKAPYDQHVINEFLASAYINRQNYAEASKRLEAQIDDGFTPESARLQMTRVIAEINYQLRNYDKAIVYGRRAMKTAYGDETIENVVGQAYYLKGDWRATRDFEDALATAAAMQGERPRKMVLQLLYSACVKLQDERCAARALDRLNAGAWRPDLAARQVPVGEALAYYFAPPDDAPISQPTAPADPGLFCAVMGKQSPTK